MHPGENRSPPGERIVADAATHDFPGAVECSVKACTRASYFDVSKKGKCLRAKSDAIRSSLISR